MQLTNRGVSYEYRHPSIEVTEGELLNKYQSRNDTCHYPRHIPVPHPPLNVSYRRLANRSARMGQTAQEENEAPKFLYMIEHPLTRDRQEILTEIARVHLNNICQNLEHRLRVAQAKQDHELIKVLEAECQQLTCSL